VRVPESALTFDFDFQITVNIDFVLKTRYELLLTREAFIFRYVAGAELELQCLQQIRDALYTEVSEHVTGG
jgi:hypothetical protein